MIHYKYEENKENRPEIVKHLQAYNITYTGDKLYEERFVYAYDNNELVGVIYVDMGWDWVSISKVHYNNREILQCLVAQVCEYFKDKASGMKYHGDELTILDDFSSIGFSCVGKIDSTPLQKDYYYYANTTFDIQSNLELDCFASDKIDEDKEKEVTSIYGVKPKINTSDLVVMAYDNDRFIGGVHGEIYDDAMYVSLLVVLKEYRGRSIGSILMSKIEEMAKNKGIVCVNLGTCEFQAKPFYEKIGYKVVATLQDYPKGFEEYTMVKRLDDKLEGSNE